MALGYTWVKVGTSCYNMDLNPECEEIQKVWTPNAAAHRSCHVKKRGKTESKRCVEITV